MNSLDVQLNNIIQRSLNSSGSLEILLKGNKEENYSIKDIVLQQEEIKQSVGVLTTAIKDLRKDLEIIVHHHNMSC